MKKTLRFLALTGIMALIWLATNTSVQAAETCESMGGKRCTADAPCTSSTGDPGICFCSQFGYWSCMF